MVLRLGRQSQTLLRAGRSSCLSSHFARHSSHRNVHSLPSLGPEKDTIFTKYGVPGLFSKQTVEETWSQYQSHLLNVVNDEVRGTTLETEDIKTLHEHTSNQRDKAYLHNHAAQAHYNHFFFKGLSAAAEPEGPPTLLRNNIEEWFESLDHLGQEVLDTAMSMFGNGYVWVMCQNSTEKTWRILPTYNAGSPYTNAHLREPRPGSALADGLIQQATNRAGIIGKHSGQVQGHRGNFDGTPILCLKVWEHQFMRDYGLAGKEAYIQNWWRRIDWSEAVHRFNHIPEVSYQQNIYAALQR